MIEFWLGAIVRTDGTAVEGGYVTNVGVVDGYDGTEVEGAYVATPAYGGLVCVGN